jgi:hypothetical protein
MCMGITPYNTRRADTLCIQQVLHPGYITPYRYRPYLQGGVHPARTVTPVNMVLRLSRSYCADTRVLQNQ